MLWNQSIGFGMCLGTGLVEAWQSNSLDFTVAASSRHLFLGTHDLPHCKQEILPRHLTVRPQGVGPVKSCQYQRWLFAALQKVRGKVANFVDGHLVEQPGRHNGRGEFPAFFDIAFPDVEDFSIGA